MKLYHRACPTPYQKSALETSLRKNGLLSHSTIGMSTYEGDPIDPIEHRIWVQDGEIGEEYLTEHPDCLIVRINTKALRTQDLDIKPDDQYEMFKYPSYVIYRECHDQNDDGCDFSIPPELLTIKRYDHSEWIPLPKVTGWTPPNRTIWERLTPNVREKFTEFEIDPRDQKTVDLFVEEYVNKGTDAERFQRLLAKGGKSSDRS